MFAPASDVDRAKDFYVNKVNFNADYDERPGCGFRFVQLTPPGLACSICLGEGLTNAAPGTAPKLQMVVANIESAHAQFAATGVDVWKTAAVIRAYKFLSLRSHHVALPSRYF